MRFLRNPPSLLALLTILSQSNTVIAGPFSKDALHDLGFSFLLPRQCGGGYCGDNNKYCCELGQGCFTSYGVDFPIAYCSSTVAGAATASEGYAVYTTTYTETDLVVKTSTYTASWQVASTVVAATVTSAPPAICTPSLGQSSCGTICCASDQRCAGSNSCTAYVSTYIGGVTSVAGSTYSAPVKPTSGGVSTATSVVSHTTTAPFQTAATATGSSFPITSSDTSKGLSGGAIAGIVIGVIAAVIILLLICFCCILKEGIEGLLAIFGLGTKRRRSTERVETVERYSRHGSASGASRREHSGWFGGGRPTRVDSVRKEKKSGGFGLGGIGLGLLGLAAVLGLKRQHDKKEKSAASDVSSSYYTESYTGTSASK
jgi:hypothetical protein